MIVARFLTTFLALAIAAIPVGAQGIPTEEFSVSDFKHAGLEGPSLRNLQQDLTIAQLFTAFPALSSLTELLEAANLTSVLADPDVSLTSFAPINQAFAVLDADLLALLSSPDYFMHLQNLLLYHVLDGVIRSSDLSDEQELTMLNGESLTVLIDDGGLQVASRLGLENGEGVVARATFLDIQAANGQAHVIDAVLLPSFVYRTIVDLMAIHSTLLSLIASADLEETLVEGSFTLFAPTNEAFGALPMDTVGFLITPEGLNDLTTILTYHVSADIVTSEKLVNGDEIETLEGNSVTIGVTAGTTATAITVDGATVTNLDVLAKNGVSHTIDTVLKPPTVSLPFASAPTAAPSSGPTVISSSIPTSAPALEATLPPSPAPASTTSAPTDVCIAPGQTCSSGDVCCGGGANVCVGVCARAIPTSVDKDSSKDQFIIGGEGGGRARNAGRMLKGSRPTTTM